MARPLEASATAPAKIILFGEHAVVYGEPSVSLALDRRTRVKGAAVGEEVTVNGHPLNPRWHRYIEQAVAAHWKGGLRLQVDGDIPSGSGMGSSAALSVATTAVVLRLGREADVGLEEVAKAAYLVELEAQGAASPNDTTICTAGGGVMLSPRREEGLEPLWDVARGETTWHAHRIPVPELPLVVGFTGSKGRTADQVAKVAHFVERNAFGRDLVRDIGRLTREGVEALKTGDLAALGRVMDRNHEALHTLGVDTPELSRLVEAARRVAGTYGAKLTGAGGGGSMIALTEDPAEVARVLAGLGVEAFKVKASPKGVVVTPA